MDTYRFEILGLMIHFEKSKRKKIMEEKQRKVYSAITTRCQDVMFEEFFFEFYERWCC